MEIKNCPFCGGRGHVDMSHGSNKPYIGKDKELKSTINLYHVFCGNCLAKSMDYEEIDDAIVAWNRRSGDVDKVIKIINAVTKEYDGLYTDEIDFFIDFLQKKISDYN